MMYKIINKVINKSVNYLEKKVDHRYKAAKILGKSISNRVTWIRFPLDFSDFDDIHSSFELKEFCWVDTCREKQKPGVRQKRYTCIGNIGVSKWWDDPQEFVVAVIFCQVFPNKKFFKALSRLNVWPSYKYLYNLEIKIAPTVMEMIIVNGG